jgi:F0F1-type ATP synthase assembly protein I
MIFMAGFVCGILVGAVLIWLIEVLFKAFDHGAW